MKRIKLISITILTLISMVVSAQTTKTVGGSSANYRTLKAAFDAVNNGVLNGNIVFQIIANTTESATATLYQSGYGGLSSYSSVSVYPTVTGCTITGNLASALIDINGADNVIIDGRLNASGSTVDLTITNTSTSSAVGTCVVNFQNDATNNYLIWCNLKGAVTSINSGVVKIGGASGATGNNNIQISRNKITGTTSSNRPTNGIISIGNSTGNNSQITISYNEIFDIFNSASTTLGISVRDYSTDFDIIGNHIYETSTVTPSAGFSYYPIYISNTSGNGFLVQSNYIGGQTTYCGGGAFTKTNSWAHTFAAIYVNVGTSSASTISGNYVRNINWSNSDNVDFHGIQHVAGTVTISTNNIGESTGTGSLTYSCDSNHATGTGFYGIKAGLTGSVTIDQNVIGSITTSNPNDLATNIFAIYCGSGSTALEITSNTIGSNTTANSIYASSVSTTTAQSVRAITLGSSGTINIDGNLIANLTNGTTASSTSVDGRAGGIYIYKASGSLSITDNIIKEIKNSNANNVSSENHSVSGMLIFGGVAGVTISGNRISNLSNDFATFTGRVYGIYADLGTTTNNIHSNFIQGLTTSSATSLTNAIHLKAGVTSCYNNIINMGGNNACGLYGIYDHGAASQNVNIYHNTIYISGAPTSGSANSAGIYSNANSNNRNFRNNIVVNARSNNGSSGSHYAMYFAYATAGTLTLDYNDYQSTGTGGQLAYYNSANVNSIPLIASQDANSLNEGPLFASAGGTSAANYDPANTGLYGASGLGISTDYAGTTRTTPTCMGAYESPLSGTVDVYASAVLQATYSTLKAAFDAINAGTHTGALTIELNASTTETLTATLNASGSGSASYTSINIYPTTTGLSISGNLASPFIDLNGADNVTIDGREDATGSTKSLTIINTSTSTTGGTSTIRFINDASNNTVKYCTIKGSELVSTSGIIFFSTTTATNGNDNNTIEYNNITNSNDSNRPLNAIFSFGTSAKDNSNNTISNNNIYDFFNHATTSQGIYLSSFTTNWTISNNHFYETASFSPTASVAYKVIYLNNTSGNNFTVSDNYIGGSTTSCGGSEWTKPLGQNNSFAGIYLSVGTATASNINGNTITNFNWSNSGGSHWNAFYHVAGNVNIGTTVGNTIGATTGNGAITCGSNSSGFSIVGLMINGTGNINFSNNTFGSITAANTNATLAVGVFGVYSNASSGTNVFTNNLIGSTTTTNSIYISSVSSTEAQPIHGFYLITTGTNTLSNNIIVNINNNTTNTTASTYGAVSGIFLSGGTNNVYNNTIRDLTIANANNSTVTTASVNGIVLASSSYVNTVYNNTIYNLSNTYASFAGQIAGIYFMGSTGANSCYKNFIHSLSATGASSTEASIYGIKAVTGVTTYYNNIINLGGNTITTIYGIYDAGAASQTFNAYHNSIYIGGTLISGSTNKSYCLFSAAASNTRKINNNILQNSRSTTSGASLHYAISQTANTNLDCNYNDYYTTGTGGVLGIMTTDRTTLAAWQFATSGDDVSLNENPAFASAGGTAATDYIPAHTGLFGITSLGISTDYAANSRTVNFTMGAYETDLSFPVEIWKTGVEQESFATLKAAFDAINAGTHTGALTIKINSSTTESASAVLNASGSGAASYTSVNIYPTTTGLSLSGTLASPLIDLDGADNVTIDGRVNASGSTKSLEISNTSTSSTAGTSTIRFINDASNNTVKYCTLKGSTTDVSAGLVSFSTTTGTTGNENNTIDNNDITTSSDLNRPINAVFSSGTAAKENGNILISNNNIYNFLNRGSTSNGINFGSNTSSGTISGNSFYETSTLTPTGAGTMYFIRINNTSSYSFNISNNYFGGTSASCGGSNFTKSNEYSNVFSGIYLNTSTSGAVEINGNTMKSINFSNKDDIEFSLINIAGGSVNIGTTSGNTFGSTSTNSSIYYSCDSNYASGTGVKPIQIAGGGDVYIDNNTFGGFTTNNSNTAHATNMYLVYSLGSGLLSVSDNTIGSATTANNIQTSSPATDNLQALRGITYGGTGTFVANGNTFANFTNYTTNSNTSTQGRVGGIWAGSGTVTITNNTIHDMKISNANTSLSDYLSCVGITLRTTEGGNTISGNSIYNLTNDNTSFTGNIAGIFLDLGTASTNNIHRNFVRDLNSTGASTNAKIYGIYTYQGLSDFSNNIIGLTAATNNNIYGIYDRGAASNNMKAYHNTVYIGGSQSSLTNKSYCLYSNAASNTRDYSNNILQNARSTSGGSNLHYAMYLNYATNTNLTSDHNDLYVSGTGGTVGYYNSTNYSTLTTFKSATSNNAGSVSFSPQFETPGGTDPADYRPIASNLAALPIASVTNDYDNALRSDEVCTMGAFELPEEQNVLPFELISLTAECTNDGKLIEWTTASEYNNEYFEIQKLNDNTWIGIGQVNGSGNSLALNNYSFIDSNPVHEIEYFRLKQVDFNGDFTYSEITVSTCKNFVEKLGIEISPNPSSDLINIEIPNTDIETVNSLIIYNQIGEIVADFEMITSESSIRINISELPTGIYYVRLIIDEIILNEMFIKD